MAGKLVKLEFGSGIHKETTEYAEDGKWVDGDKVRFRANKPEVMRGHEVKVSGGFEGNARDLLVYSDNDQFKRAVFGTEKKLFQHSGDQIFDITPVSASTTLANAFTCAISSNTVTVSATAHGRQTGDFVFFTSSTTIGGNILLGTTTYPVSVINANTFALSVATTASAAQSSTGGGTIHYLIAGGTQNAVTGLGYGAGSYNAGVSVAGARAWNQPTSIGASDFNNEITQWSLDNYGEDVVANRRGGTIYYFDSDASTSPVRAAAVTNAPSTVNSVIVSPNDRHLICLGSNIFGTTASPHGDFNPMTVRWSDQEDRNNWTPSVSSTSGEVLLTDGTKVVGGVRSRNAINIWTDNSLWTMQFVGPPFTFRFTQVGTNCGLIGQHSGVDYDGRSYWMDTDNFYVFDGTVKKLPCSVRRFVFDRLNRDQVDKIYAGINSEFTEIIWLYPSTDSDECDSYVIYSPEEKYWTIGSTFFTTFADRNIFGNTITTGTTAGGSNLYNNEPKDIYTANGQAVTSFIESGALEIGNGDDIMFIDRIIPDFDITNGDIKFKILTKRYPEDTETITKGPYTVGSTTKKVNVRARGRQAKYRVSCNETGTKWRWGSIRAGMQADGER